MGQSPRGESSGSVPNEIPPTLASLSALLDAKPETLALGDEELRDAGLVATKFVFDQALKSESVAQRHISPFLASLQPTEAPKTRSQARAEAQDKGKSKVNVPPRIEWSTTPLDALHIAGVEDSQIWAQLDLRSKALCDMLSLILEETPDDDDDAAVQKSKKLGDEDGMDLDDLDASDLDGSDDDEDEEDEDEDDDPEDDSASGSGMSELDALLMTEEEDDSSDGEPSEHELDLRDPSDDDEPNDEGSSTGKDVKGPKSALDDGFFSLAEFNRETIAAEARSRSSGRLRDEDEDGDGEDEDEDVDLFAPVDGDDEEAFDEEDLDATGELYYKDFFAPPSRKQLAGAQKAQAPPKKKRKGVIFDHEKEPLPPRTSSSESTRRVKFHDKVRVKNIKPSLLRRRVLFLNNYLKSKGLKTDSDSDESDEDDEDEDEDEEDDAEDHDGMDLDMPGLTAADFDGSDDDDEDEDEDEDGQENDGHTTIERFKDDLFADDEDADAGSSGLSTHEQRMAELSEQMRQLESENVGPRDWTLMGEATARARPANSLLEQDLDFDRASRPVPQVTEEKVSTIEALVKKRILENNFDDVVRKRPDVSMAPRKSDFELSDQKSQKSLAQLYEDDYSAARSRTAIVDDRDGKLAKEHGELEQMWENISYKLDALCNAHFTPKAPQTKIQTISNVPAASLESALPTSNAAATMLAPEEVAARATRKDLVAKSEMTPQEKRAARQRAKKARSKQRDAVVVAKGKVARGKGSVKKEKERALSAVTKGRGVTVVGKDNGRDAKGKSRGAKPAPVDGKKLKL